MKQIKKITINNKEQTALVEQVDGQIWLSTNGWSYPVNSFGTHRIKEKTKSGVGNGEISAPMPGQILKVFVKNGQSVEEGDSLFIVEAMKMEHTLKAPSKGQVENLAFKAGDSVSSTDVILKITTETKDQ
jgi:acetyl/propionyl-CoA carboxylase alpha subunit